MYLQEPRKFCTFSAEAFLKHPGLEQLFFHVPKQSLAQPQLEQEIHIYSVFNEQILQCGKIIQAQGVNLKLIAPEDHKSAFYTDMGDYYRTYRV